MSNKVIKRHYIDALILSWPIVTMCPIRVYTNLVLTWRTVRGDYSDTQHVRKRSSLPL